MIDPCNVTNYYRTWQERLEFLMFAICVAGKNSDIIASKVDTGAANICASRY
jgi:hypothetical protein